MQKVLISSPPQKMQRVRISKPKKSNAESIYNPKKKAMLKVRTSNIEKHCRKCVFIIQKQQCRKYVYISWPRVLHHLTDTGHL